MTSTKTLKLPSIESIIAHLKAAVAADSLPRCVDLLAVLEADHHVVHFPGDVVAQIDAVRVLNARVARMAHETRAKPCDNPQPASPPKYVVQFVTGERIELDNPPAPTGGPLYVVGPSWLATAGVVTTH